jgi:hypothetical protein
MKKSLITLAAVSVVAVVAVVASAQAEEATSAGSGPAVTASAITGLANQSHARMSAADHAVLERGLPSVPQVTLGRGAPTKSQLGQSGRVLLQTPTERVSAVDTTQGDVCWVSTTSDQTYGADCAPNLVNGVSFSTTQRSDQGWWITGIADDQVTGVTVVTASGSRSVAQLGDNAFAWQGRSAGDYPVRLEVARGGVTAVADTGVAGDRG